MLPEYFILFPEPTLYYTKKAIIIKDKIPPIIKKGPNGINFCFFLYAHAAPNMHAITSAIANPVGPHHSPPTAINFISPIPIGVVAFGLRCVIILSKINPIVAAII